MKVEFKFKKAIYNSEKMQKIQECMEYVLEHDYGQMLLNTELAKKLGYNIENEIEQKKFKSMMSRIKNYSAEYGYVLKGVHQVGYYILKPQHVANHCFRTYIRSSQRTNDKSLWIMNHIDKTELEDERLEEYDNFIELQKEIIDKTESLIDNSKYFNRMDYYNNLKD